MQPSMQEYETASTSCHHIPKVFHFLHLSSDRALKKQIQTILRFKRIHPDWSLICWTDLVCDDIPGVICRSIDTIELRSTVPEIDSLLIKLQVIDRYGGVFLPKNARCNSSLDPLISQFDLLLGSNGQINGSFFTMPYAETMGSIASHPAIMAAITEGRRILAAGDTSTFFEEISKTISAYLGRSGHNDVVLPVSGFGMSHIQFQSTSSENIVYVYQKEEKLDISDRAVPLTRMMLKQKIKRYLIYSVLVILLGLFFKIINKRYENKKGVYRRVAFFILGFQLLIFAVSSLWIIRYKWINPSTTRYMRQELHGALQSNPSATLQQKWIAFDDISENAVLCVLVSEDAGFLLHSGFEVKNMWKSLKTYAATNKSKYTGGSTISQQLVKNMFLYQDQTILRKVVEAYITFLMELYLGKKRILEMYMNTAELAEGVFGFEQGAKVHFGKSLKELNIDQLASLCAILPNPKNLSIYNPSDWLRSRIIFIQENCLGDDISIASAKYLTMK